MDRRHLNVLLFHEFRREVPASEAVMAHEALMEGDGRFDALNHVLVQRPLHFQDGFFARLCDNDEF